MAESSSTKIEELKQKFNQDTAKINWSLLDQYQQQESVIEVDDGLDLIVVACAFAQDNHAQVKIWLDQSLIGKVSDADAQAWKKEDLEVWAVVVAPWVLVQKQKPQE